MLGYPVPPISVVNRFMKKAAAFFNRLFRHKADDQ